MQFQHQPGADFPRRQLAIRPVLQIGFDPIGDGFELLNADRPLFARAQESGDELLALKRLPVPVLLYDTILDFLNPLTTGEALATLEALPAPTDDVAFAALTRVHHLVAEVAAVRTLHLSTDDALSAWRGMTDGRTL